MAEDGGYAALEATAGFVPRVVAVGIAKSCLDSTENRVAGYVGIARSHGQCQCIGARRTHG